MSATHWRDAQEDELARMVTERRRLKPLTRNQEVYQKAIETSTVTICVGPPGTGKTYVAVGVAVGMLRAKRVERIVLTRPLVTCGKGLGFLPGGVLDKVAPYMRPMLDVLDDFYSPREIEEMVADETIRVEPLELLRGSSLKRSVVILDEAQNATYTQLRMLLTRFGQGSRVVVCGDYKQTDLPYDEGDPLPEVMGKLKGHPDIFVMRFTKADQCRHPLIQFIDEKLEE